MLRILSRMFLASLTLLMLTGAVLGQDDPFAGVTIESLGAASPTMTDGLALVFLRITMEPGASIGSHSHPGSVIVVVDEGVFATVFTQGEGTLTRGGGEAQTLEVGVEAMLNPGDSLSYEGSAGHTMANGGSEPLVLLVSALLDPEEEGFLFHEPHAGH